MKTQLQIIEELNEIFTEVIDEGEVSLTPETTANDVDGWDSLNHIQIIYAVEKKYGFKFTLPEIQNLKNISDLVNLIIEKSR
ncbi:acyl carrier protein [Nubsella zeaxanthinifaciens]|uniref:acyl carrier protein n=1 Tax=Nubsella zeaxanthinifaciens TaxID=392412 RepID=UPI003D05D9E3